MLIGELEKLVANEENIGKAIQTIQNIQERWRNIGPIPRQKRQDIQKTYSHLMDDFQYNINIYKEIKDHDLVKNAGLKQAVIDKLKALDTVDSIKTVEHKLHAYQDEWNDIGGTSTEAWEKLKTDYWDTVNALYAKIRHFYDDRREAQKENIRKKLALIDKVDEVLAVECQTQSEWQKATNSILAIQEEWKTIGFGPKKENEVVWKGFRAKCDQFFNAKKLFFKDIHAAFDQVKVKKQALIEKVEAIKDSTEWEETTRLIVNIQKDWKKLGSAGQRHENKLWQNFRKPIDHFFGQKEAYYTELDKSNAGNLELKVALIEEIKAFNLPADPKSAINELKTFSKRFNDIGNVPFKQKDSIYKAYKSAIDEKYQAIDLDQQEKDRMLYLAKVEAIYLSPNKDKEIDQENFALRKRIDEKIKEKHQVENNLSFFAHADDNNPLLKNVRVKLDGIESDIKQLKSQLTLLNQFEQESE